MSRLFRLAFRLFAALFALLALLMGYAAWEMSSAPKSFTNLTPYIEFVFARALPGTEAKVDETLLDWDNEKQTLSLRCEKAEWRDRKGDLVASFPVVEMKVGVWGLLRGRLLPVEMKADNAQFWITRHKDGVLAFGGVPENEDNGGGLDAFALLRKLGGEIANERLRHHIAIKEASVAVRDLKREQDWTLNLREISLQHDRKEAKGRAKVEVAQKERESFMNADYTFDHKNKLHQVRFDFQDIRLSLLAPQHPKLATLAALDLPLSGSFSFGVDTDVNLSNADLRIEGKSGFLREESLWVKPREVQKVSLAAHYDHDKEKLEVTDLQLDFGGPKLSVKAQAQTPSTSDMIWMRVRGKDSPFSVSVTLENLPIDRFDEIWPKPAIPDARDWIVASLSKGQFTKGEVTIKGQLKWDDLANSTLESGGGTVSARGGRVRYLEGMPSVENVDADATFDLDSMDVKILSGNTGPIRIKPFTLRMTNFNKNVQYIAIPLQLAGPVRDVLKLLDSPPLGYAKAIGLKPEDGSGQVEGTLTLRMPMLDALLLKDVEVKADARFRNFGLANMIPKTEISDGDLAFTLDLGGFALKGPVSFNKVPLQLAWKSRFEASSDLKQPLHEATVTGAVKGNGWVALGLPSADVAIKGETPVTISYANYRKGFSELSGAVDMKPAAVHVPAIDWRKPMGSSAKLSFVMDIEEGKNLRLEKIELAGPRIKVKGTASIDSDTGAIRALTLRPFILGRSNATVSFSEPEDLLKPSKLSITGETLDISGLNGGKDERKEEQKEAAKAEASPAKPKDYTIKLSKLYTSEKGWMSQVVGQAQKDKEGWSKIDFEGLAQGEMPVSIKLLPEGEGLHFSVLSDDFGKALLGLGFSETVKGGKLWIDGRSEPETPRDIKGLIKITSFSVSDWPLLARLLNALSPFGFVDLITGEASFDGLRAEFRWAGDRLDLNKARAAGSVIGLNLDGHVNLADNTLNLNGTAVPFSFMNSLIGSIPLLGDVITGGDGQGVIAAAFTVKGNASDPDISVNPVSLLTPGFLRNLFFGADESDETPQP